MQRLLLLVMLALASLAARAQQTYTIKGAVLDLNNEPLVGATVHIPGTTVGVVTDIDGVYSLNVPAGTEAIEVSFVGYETRTIPFSPRNLNVFRVIVLQEGSDTELEDVTVVAFGRQKTESVLGSVTSVRPTELKTTSSNLTQGFAGRLAGVIAYQRTGVPGDEGSVEFFIRGVTTFGTGMSNPLILIDNMELTTSDLARMNPDDIESFSILKDATATALYGARGANGVILVTTKEGKEGRARFNLRLETSFSGSTRDVKIADPLTYMRLHNEAVRTRDPNAALPYLESEIAAREEGRNPMVYPMVDWKKMMMKDWATNYRGNLNISGGGSVARYYVALAYARDYGLLKEVPTNLFDNNIKVSTYTVRTNVNINLTKSTVLSTRLNGSFRQNQGPTAGANEVYIRSIKASPVLFPAVYAPDEAHRTRSYPLYGNYGEGGAYLNPYADMASGYLESENTSIVAQLEVSQNFNFLLEGLRARLLLSTTRGSAYTLARSYTPFYFTVDQYDRLADTYTLRDLNPDQGTDYLGFTPGSKTVTSSMSLEAHVQYDKKIADRHSLSGMLVWQARESKNANAGSLQASLPSRNLGLSGRFTYGFDERYYGEFNFGYNGSERFDVNHRWGFFPSWGVGWLLSKEEFWKNAAVAAWWDMLKLKATYGLVGNDAIANERFFYLSDVNMNDGNRSFYFGTDFSAGQNGISINRYANRKIGWEVARKLNLGFEWRMFENFNVQADFFREVRSNILQNRGDIPSTMGFESVIRANIGEAEGKGFEVQADYSHSFYNGVWVTARGTFTYATSKYRKFEEPDYAYAGTPWRSRVGTNISQNFGYIAERLFIDQDDVDNSPTQFGDYMAGDIKYKDINDDGVIDENDQVPIGYPTTPEINYGFGFSVGWKGFDLSSFFQGSARSAFFIQPGQITPFAPQTIANKQANNALLQAIADNHWSETNQDVYAFWPRLSASAITNNQQTSTWWYRDGAFLRWKTAELGYTLPKRVRDAIRFDNCRFYVTATNILNISGFKLWDSEMGGNGLQYPVQTAINVGLQVSL